ncbi:hypothetical protein Tsubulata_038778 [Turnera subulata]|uniref:GBF-interacting protein 1 N-terminal domain-containing protein n=1 Tax=Turnera subulata TaxID=218843 RepID=A0A9Q0FG01_9ROSI|nr:hypothetical protein Tsubulata_038778 [Turnera subulata]
MSRKAGGGGGGAARSTVPEAALGLIKDIREITGKQHSDEDIYTVLQDCNMDPDETAQRLLYIDTFHEVKSKRDRRKETSVVKGRWARGGRGNYYAPRSDAIGRRNSAYRRENGAIYTSEKDSSASVQASQGRNDMLPLPVAKDSAINGNGHSSLANGSSNLGHGPPYPDGEVLTKDNPPVDVKNPETVVPLPAVASSVSNRTFMSVVRDHIPAPSTARHAGVQDAVNTRLGLKVAEQNQIEANGQVSLSLGSKSPKNEKVASRIVNSRKEQKASGKSKTAAKNTLSEPVQVSSLSKHDDSLPISSSGKPSSSTEGSVEQAMVSPEDAQAEAISKSLHKPPMPNGYVTFPDHLKVPDALKSGLIFGNFDVTPGSGTNYSDGSGSDLTSTNTIQLSNEIDAIAQESSTSNEGISTTTHVNHSDKSDSSQHVPEQAADVLMFSKSDPAVDQIRHNPLLHGEVDVNSIGGGPPNYAASIMPTEGDSDSDSEQNVGDDGQARVDSHLSSFASENPTSSSTPNLSPPVLNSPAASQPVFFRPPYPPNFFQYGHYFNPYFVPMHLVSHSGLPQQQAAGSGGKLSLQSLKPVSGAGNPTPIAPLYGSFGSSLTSFNPVPAVSSGTSGGDGEGLSASQLKENNAGPLREVAAWIPPQGQDITSLQQLNSLYHLHQGQHLSFSPARPGHGPYPGIYQAVQSVAALASVNPPVQQSQAISGANETIAAPSAAAQQPQLAQMNWTPSY